MVKICHNVPVIVFCAQVKHEYAPFEHGIIDAGCGRQTCPKLIVTKGSVAQTMLNMACVIEGGISSKYLDFFKEAVWVVCLPSKVRAME
jgi:hypothetical protein